MPEKNGSWRATVLRAVVQVIVALLGLAGVGMGTWAQVRSGNTGDALQATVEQLNDQTIPRLEAALGELRADNKFLTETLAQLRERTARLEGRIRIKWPRSFESVSEESEKAEAKAEASVGKKLESLAAKKPEALPRLEVQQIFQDQVSK